MIRITNAQLWVHDQEEALAFYTKVVGWEIRADVTIPDWNFRWLTVGPADQPDFAVVLMSISMAPVDDATKAQLTEVVAKGMGGTVFLETDDIQKDYEVLSARGVPFTDPPTTQPYGIDTGFRDPSGNNIRLTQVLEFDPSRGQGG
jgi:predicted enzyme related to lactoylglutathione lyase